MILVNSVAFFEQIKKGVEEFCNHKQIEHPDKTVEDYYGIAFRWKSKMVLMVGDDATEHGSSNNELFVRLMDENMMGSVHFISKDYAKDELIDFLERWFL